MTRWIETKSQERVPWGTRWIETKSQEKVPWGIRWIAKQERVAWAKKLLFLLTIICTIIFSNITFADYTDNLEDKEILSAQLTSSRNKINSDSIIKYIDKKIEKISDNLKKLSKLYDKIPLIREKIEGGSNQTYIMLSYILDYIEAKIGLLIYDLESDSDSILTVDDIVVYVDENCTEEICTETYIKDVINNQILWWEKAEISIVSLTDKDWNLFKDTLAWTPIIFFDKNIANRLIKRDKLIKNYINQIGDNYYIVLWTWIPGNENLCGDGIDNNGDGDVDADDKTCHIVTLLYDSRCTEGDLCNIDSLEANLSKQTFSLWFIVNTVDYNTKEWKALYEKVWWKLPTILATDLSADMKKDLEEVNFLKEIDVKQYSYEITFLPSTWDPTGEICDNGIDDDENGQIDCEDISCSSKTQCREEKKGQLDVFIMSYCPFWEIAMKQIPLLQEVLDSKFELVIHYIAKKIGDGYGAEDFQSLHGVSESEEDIRQLCIQKYYGTQKLVDYMQVRYKNADNYGKITDDYSVALEGIDADVDEIDICVTGWEWGKLLAEDIKIAQDLGIGASPTWMANNRYRFGGIDVNKIKSGFCKYNEEIEGCESDDVIDSGNSGGGVSCGK